MLKFIFAVAAFGGILLAPSAVLAQAVVINEIMSNPVGTDNGARSEWVELYNNDSTAVDLSGYTVIANRSVPLQPPCCRPARSFSRNLS